MYLNRSQQMFPKLAIRPGYLIKNLQKMFGATPLLWAAASVYCPLLRISLPEVFLKEDALKILENSQENSRSLEV